MRYLLAVMCSLVVSFVSAAEEDDYVPLGEGMEWTWDAKSMAPDGTVSSSTVKETIGAKEERDGKSYYRATIHFGGGEKDTVLLTRKDKNGIYTINLTEQTQEFTELVFPAKTGQSWKRPTGSDNRMMDGKVMGMETVTIAGKSYEKCIYTRTALRDGSYTEDVWEAPKVGRVKWEVFFQNGSYMTLTLREFKPGK